MTKLRGQADMVKLRLVKTAPEISADPCKILRIFYGI